MFFFQFSTHLSTNKITPREASISSEVTREAMVPLYKSLIPCHFVSIYAWPITLVPYALALVVYTPFLCHIFNLDKHMQLYSIRFTGPFTLSKCFFIMVSCLVTWQCSMCALIISYGQLLRACTFPCQTCRTTNCI